MVAEIEEPKGSRNRDIPYMLGILACNKSYRKEKKLVFSLFKSEYREIISLKKLFAVLKINNAILALLHKKNPLLKRVFNVPTRRLELLHLSELPPQGSVSTNSTTWASMVVFEFQRMPLAKHAIGIRTAKITK